MVEKYLDSHWASNKKIYKLTFEFIFILNKKPIKLYFKKKTISALSLIKTKYICLTLAAKMVI